MKVKELAESLSAQLIGEGSTEVTGIASINSAKASDLVFVDDEKHVPAALSSAAGAIIAGDFASKVKANKPLLITSNARLAFARAAAMMYKPSGSSPGVHSTAAVASSARVGKRSTVEAYAVIGERVTIGQRTRIGAGAVVGENASIGDGCNIAPHVTIYPGVRVGNRVIVHAGAVLGSDGFGFVRDPASAAYIKFPQIGGLEIGDDVEIGANTTVDRGALDVTVIARGTKLDNLVHVGHNVRIGEDVVIAAQTGFSGSVVVEDDAVIGGQVGIGDHARIGKDVILGSQSGVLPKKTLRAGREVLWGTPARPLRQYLKELAVLARLAKKEQ